MITQRFSPKHRYSGTIYCKDITGSADSFTFTSDNKEVLKHWLKEQAKGRPAHIIIKENKEVYPKFKYVEVENYEINQTSK